MRTYIYGAHVRCGYWIEADSIADIKSKLQRPGHDIKKLKDSRKHWVEQVSELPKDECSARQCGLLQWCEWRSGTPSKRGIFCRVALMNDEVLWQCRTGSVLTYRFESLADSQRFFISLFPDSHVQTAARSRQYEVGDIVKVTCDVKIVEPCGYIYKAGSEFRVYDFIDGCVVPSGIDGVTYIRIPNSGGSKAHIGYGLIPTKHIEAVHLL